MIGDERFGTLLKISQLMWDLLISPFAFGSIFTEIRLKKVIEFRSLDTCNFGCICNGPSFFTGLIYGSLEETYEIIKNWKKKEVMEAYLKAPKQGLNTLLQDKKLIDWAKIFLDLSNIF